MFMSGQDMLSIDWRDVRSRIRQIIVNKSMYLVMVKEHHALELEDYEINYNAFDCSTKKREFETRHSNCSVAENGRLFFRIFFFEFSTYYKEKISCPVFFFSSKTIIIKKYFMIYIYKMRQSIFTTKHFDIMTKRIKTPNVVCV